MTTIDIKDWSGRILASKDMETLKEALEAAVKDGTNLGGAYLRGAYLRGANLDGAYLDGAYLGGANLDGANLRGAYLRGAYLRGAYLRGAYLNWLSHDLLAEILLCAAGDDVEKRKFAGLVLVSQDWCWKNFLALNDPLEDWALTELAAYVKDGDGVPAVLKRKAESLKVPTE